MGKYTATVKEGQDFAALTREGIDLVTLAQRKREYTEWMIEMFRNTLRLKKDDEVEFIVEWIS